MSDLPAGLVPVEYDPFASGDPEAAGSAAASSAMSPAVNAHFDELRNGLIGWGNRQAAIADRLSGASLATRALDPESLDTAIGVAMGAGPGAIRAYHGSPYDFDAFDASKIGTGEGAQAYGHGLYFAENPKVAGLYRDNLSQGSYLTSDGLANYGDIHTELANAAKAAAGLHPDQARQVANYVLDGIDVYGSPAAYLKQYEFPDGKFGDAYRAAANAAAQRGAAPNPGKMYEVNINAEPHQLLDWDKPLSQQGPSVRDFVDSLEQRRRAELVNVDPSKFADYQSFDAAHGAALERAAKLRVNPDWTGAQLYESSKLVPGEFRDPAAASASLRDAGIPGIQYLDQGSRAAGAGSSNYVVFDPKIIDIVRKYGLAGLVTGGAPYLVPVEHDPFAAEGDMQ